MKIALASDHGGFSVKMKIRETLERQGHSIQDFGCHNLDSCDYPDFAIPAVQSVVDKKNDRAILICTNGIGMCMAANKFPGILAALVYSEKTAAMTRKHHDSRVLCLGGKEFSEDELLKFVDIWMNTEFEGDRHKRRIDKILKLDFCEKEGGRN
ncbi:ribose 5-phosphate isomerase B [Candidatus Sumerlaeota bacterium]|nr:ribose 5-phosphate isomerase B [Candidatus Sumerlaeota bacterium]